MLMALVSILVQLHIDGCFLAPSFSRKQGGWIRYVYKSVLRPMQNMDSETPIPRWNLALVTLLAWVVGMAVALTPDGLALIEFKSALTAISPLLEDWNASDASPCSWGGINCTDSGRVRNISLSTQQPMLEGNISASLGKLEFLEGLMLDQNMLSGSIPPELGNLSRLSNLSLASNCLTGEIPPELGNCSSLLYLSLYLELVVWPNSGGDLQEFESYVY
jgi:hypothetical protein